MQHLYEHRYDLLGYFIMQRINSAIPSDLIPASGNCHNMVTVKPQTCEVLGLKTKQAWQIHSTP